MTERLGMTAPFYFRPNGLAFDAKANERRIFKNAEGGDISAYYLQVQVERQARKRMAKGALMLEIVAAVVLFTVLFGADVVLKKMREEPGTELPDAIPEGMAGNLIRLGGLISAFASCKECLIETGRNGRRSRDEWYSDFSPFLGEKEQRAMDSLLMSVTISQLVFTIQD
ncbi:hypothetical protein Esti_006370 [Eimeria stiedai]